MTHNNEEYFKIMNDKKLSQLVVDHTKLRHLEDYLSKQKDNIKWIDLSCKMILESNQEWEIKYRCMQVIKEIMLLKRISDGKHFKDVWLTKLTDFVLKIRDQRKLNESSSVFQEDSPILWKKRLEKLILNCINAWFDIFEKFNEYYIAFSKIMALQIPFPDFDEFDMSIYKTPGLPTPKRKQKPQIQGKLAVETPQSHIDFANRLMQYRIFTYDMIISNEHLLDCSIV